MIGLGVRALEALGGRRAPDEDAESLDVNSDGGRGEDKREGELGGVCMTAGRPRPRKKQPQTESEMLRLLFQNVCLTFDIMFYRLMSPPIAQSISQ